MDENPLFEGNQCQMLVIDEVDRVLDMGFKRDVDEIITNLPKKMQVLLFSATITKSMKELARVRLQNQQFEYI